jgi:hypothetical protein
LSNEAYVRYNGLTVIQASDSIDGIAYISSVQSQVGENYDVKITCSVAGVNYSTIIHVIAASYPSSMIIDSTNLANVAPRTVPGGVCLYTSGQRANIFVTSNDEYTAEISKITYTIQHRGVSDSATYVDRGNSQQLEDLHDDYLTLSPGSVQGIKISTDSAVPSELEIYDVHADILFKSGKRMTANSVIAVGDDATPVVMSSQATMYNILNASWTAEFGTPIGRNSLYKIDLFIMSGTIDFSTQAQNLPNLVTANGTYLLKYLRNITGLIFDGCIGITQTNNSIEGEDKSMFLFDNCEKLQVLSIKNCPNLTGTVDLSHCADIRQVYSNGTDVTITLPTEPKITNFEVETPQSINLDNPTVITPNGISVGGMINLDSLVIKNVPNLKSYSTFYKIM